MAEEVKKALEELTRSADGNREAQAFLDGIKYGMKYAPAKTAGAEKED